MGRHRFLFLIVFITIASATSCTLFNPLDRYGPSDRGDATTTSNENDATITDGSFQDADAIATPDRSPPLPCDPTKDFAAPEPISELNTPGVDFVTDLSSDELVIYVATNGASVSSGQVVHLFYATRPSRTAAFGALLPLVPLVADGGYNDFSVAVSANGLTAVVASDRFGSSDLFVVTRSNTFSVFGAFGSASVLDTAQDESTPKWSADEKTLYFDSAKSGNRDLFRSPTQSGTFGAPESITELNTPALEAAPVLSADERTIYFLSTREPSVEGDIWVATRASTTDPFGKPTPLTGVNSAGIDAPAWLSPDGCTLYLSSARAGTFDLFVSRRPP